MTTFDSIEVPMENAAWADLIKEGITVDILTWEERVRNISHSLLSFSTFRYGQVACCCESTPLSFPLPVFLI